MKMKVHIRTMLCVAAALLAAAMSSPAGLNVVATTADLGSVAREVGGSFVDVSVLAKPTEDPHFVDAKPSFIAKLARADVLIEGGAELEMGWLPPLIDGSRNTKIAAGQPGHVACAEGLALLEVPTALDRSLGDIHALGNPHYMTDPVNACRVADRIADALGAVDPSRAADYRRNAETFTRSLREKLAGWQQDLAPFRGKTVVAYHNSWPYFANRFGIRIDLFLEPKPGIPPSPAHLADVVTRMKNEHIGVIVVEPYQNRRTAEKVATEAGGVIVDFAQFPGGVMGTEGGYVQLMDCLVHSLATALKAGGAGGERTP